MACARAATSRTRLSDRSDGAAVGRPGPARALARPLGRASQRSRGARDAKRPRARRAAMRSEAVRYEAVIGLEVHAQLLTRTKAFCGCPTTYGAPPNTQVCPVCLGLPGRAPGPQRRGGPPGGAHGARALVRASGRRAASPARTTSIPDLPKGYQISQFDEPFSERGHLDIEVDGAKQDASASRASTWRRTRARTCTTSAASVVDLNRSGVAARRDRGRARSAQRRRGGGVPAHAARRSSSSSASTTATSKRGASAATPTSASAPWARRSSARASSSRTSTRSASSRRPSPTRSSGRPRCSTAAAASSRRRAAGTRTRARRSACAARKRRRTTATSRTRICPPLVLDDAFVAEVQATDARAAARRSARASSTRWGSRRTRRRCSRRTRGSRRSSRRRRRCTAHAPTKVANFVQSEVLRDVQTHGLESDDSR